MILTPGKLQSNERSEGAKAAPFAFAKTFRMNTKQAGFTLIEIMIVIAIIAGIIAVGAPKLFSTSSAMRTAVRKLAVMTREVRNNSRLYNVTSRIVINIDAEKGHQYTVESAEGNAPLLSEDQQKELDDLTAAQREGEGVKTKFSQDSRVLKGAVSLPKGLFFDGIEFGSRQKEVTEGTAMIHFFPRGLAEEVAIHLSDKKSLNWTITINPLTGRADVYERKISLKELRAP